MKDIHDVIKHAKFGDDRLSGSGVVAGQISAFPIDFAGRPYNTLTLPCERVIHIFITWGIKIIIIIIITGSFLFQRLSVVIHRFNAVLLHDCFVDEVARDSS